MVTSSNKTITDIRMYVFIGELLPRLVPLGCGVGLAGRRSCATLADTLFAVGVVLHTQVVVERFWEPSIYVEAYS